MAVYRYITSKPSECNIYYYPLGKPEEEVLLMTGPGVFPGSNTRYETEKVTLVPGSVYEVRAEVVTEEGTLTTGIQKFTVPIL